MIRLVQFNAYFDATTQARTICSDLKSKYSQHHELILIAEYSLL